MNDSDEPESQPTCMLDLGDLDEVVVGSLGQAVSRLEFP